MLFEVLFSKCYPKCCSLNVISCQCRGLFILILIFLRKLVPDFHLCGGWNFNSCSDNYSTLLVCCHSFWSCACSDEPSSLKLLLESSWVPPCSETSHPVVPHSYVLQFGFVVFSVLVSAFFCIICVKIPPCNVQHHRPPSPHVLDVMSARIPSHHPRQQAEWFSLQASKLSMQTCTSVRIVLFLEISFKKTLLKKWRHFILFICFSYCLYSFYYCLHWCSFF